jgi:para-nitrobenzyl esterase
MSEEITVKCPCGEVKGLKKKDSCLFEGIPFCHTPRFEKPLLIEKWDKVIDATKKGSEAPQFQNFSPVQSESEFYAKEFPSREVLTWNEKELNLNIITPVGGKDCPVLVFVHGGGFEIGAEDEIPFGRTEEYAKRGIVLVSISYRLNIFALYRNLNLCLYDIICAFEWIYKNISAFGGKKEDITAMGQSAGAMLLTDLSFSSYLKPYVKRMILLSGGGAFPKLASPISKKEAEPFWDSIREKAGAKNEEEMKKLPAEVIFKAWHEIRNKTKDSRLIAPGLDGEIITEAQIDSLKKGKQLDIPYLLGVTSQDFLGPVMLHLAYQWAKICQRQKKKDVFCYFFDRALPGNSYKAFHAADLWYVFNDMEECWRPFEEKDKNLCQQMINHLSSFIKTDNPSIQDRPLFYPLMQKNGLYLFDGENKSSYISKFRAYKKEIHYFLFDKGPM